MAIRVPPLLPSILSCIMILKPVSLNLLYWTRHVSCRHMMSTLFIYLLIPNMVSLQAYCTKDNKKRSYDTADKIIHTYKSIKKNNN